MKSFSAAFFGAATEAAARSASSAPDIASVRSHGSRRHGPSKSRLSASLYAASRSTSRGVCLSRPRGRRRKSRRTPSGGFDSARWNHRSKA